MAEHNGENGQDEMPQPPPKSPAPPTGYAPPLGNAPRPTEKTAMSSMARKNPGMQESAAPKRLIILSGIEPSWAAQ